MPLALTPFVFFAGRPVSFAIIPIAGIEILAALDELYKLAQAKLPPLASTLEKAANFIVPYLLRPQNASEMSLSRKWEAVNQTVLRYSAVVEVIVAIMFVFELLTPMRSIIGTFLLWQTLQMKFMMSSYTREAFAMVHARISGWTAHPMCPGIVRTGYVKLSNLLRSQAKTMDEVQAEAQSRVNAGEAPGGALGGLMNKCVVQ
jgi:hypothetical protein